MVEISPWSWSQVSSWERETDYAKSRKIDFQRTVIVQGMLIDLHLIRSHSWIRCTLDVCVEGYVTVSEIAWAEVGVEGRRVYEQGRL